MICGELFHLDWWTSWGLCVPNEDLKNLTHDLGLNEIWRLMTKCLLYASTSPILHGVSLFAYSHIFLPFNWELIKKFAKNIYLRSRFQFAWL
jgi:hypothetical protein